MSRKETLRFIMMTHHVLQKARQKGHFFTAPGGEGETFQLLLDQILDPILLDRKDVISTVTTLATQNRFVRNFLNKVAWFCWFCCLPAFSIVRCNKISERVRSLERNPSQIMHVNGWQVLQLSSASVLRLTCLFSKLNQGRNLLAGQACLQAGDMIYHATLYYLPLRLWDMFHVFFPRVMSGIDRLMGCPYVHKKIDTSRAQEGLGCDRNLMLVMLILDVSQTQWHDWWFHLRTAKWP